MRNLTDKVAIVTGASSGIGLEVARRLAARGARVALVARTRAKLEEVAAELGPSRAAAFPLDVRDLGALAKLPDEVAARLGGLDVLVNNAGMNHRGAMLDCTAEQLADVLMANLTAPAVLTRAAVPHMRGWGAVVNVASIAGMVPLPEEAAYCASKAGLRAFSRAIEVELAPRGVQVATVCPGPVDTPFFGDLETVSPIVFSQPMSTAEEVADAVLRCIDAGESEIAIPRRSGVLATVGYLFPQLAARLRPVLEQRGEKAKRAYIERKRAGG